MHVLIDPETGERLGEIEFDPYEVRLTEAGQRRDVGRYFEDLDRRITYDTGEPPEPDDHTAEREVPVSEYPEELRRQVADTASRRGLAVVPEAEAPDPDYWDDPDDG